MVAVTLWPTPWIALDELKELIDFRSLLDGIHNEHIRTFNTLLSANWSSSGREEVPKDTLMADVLENEGDLRLTSFCSKQVVMVVLQFIVREMVPPARSESQGW